MELPRVGILFIAILVVHTSAVAQSPPHITRQPLTDELLFQVARPNTMIGKPVFIECEADGDPAPTYRWNKNGKEFNWQEYEDRMQQDRAGGTLIFFSLRDEDIGHYQCFAENEWGIATSNSVFLRKAELASFKDFAVDKFVIEGAPLDLTCRPPYGWPKPNVFWLIQETVGGIRRINDSRITLDPEGNLWFSNVTRNDQSDGFVYACAATSKFSYEFKVGYRVKLTVVATGKSASENRREPVQQYVTKGNEVAVRGKTVEIYCIFGGTPMPQTVWSKDGRPIQWSDRVTQDNQGRRLVIKQAQLEDEGVYTCEVSNGVGQAKSHSVNLQVMVPPYFTREPEIVNAVEGETVEFDCEASGVPRVQTNWIHNGRPIGESPPNPRRKVTPNKVTIERVEKRDTGNYGCNATNSLGYVYKDVYVNVLEPTNASTNFTLLEVTDSVSAL